MPESLETMTGSVRLRNFLSLGRCFDLFVDKARLLTGWKVSRDQLALALNLGIFARGPEMCLSLEHQNPSKTSEKMGYFDRVTVSLNIL